MKPQTCARCGAGIDQPATGRPRVYCGPLCRRDAEYRLRRVQSHLARAERAAQSARLDVVTGDGWKARRAQARAEFWEREARSLGDELRQALTNLSADEGDEPDEGGEGVKPPRLRSAG